MIAGWERIPAVNCCKKFRYRCWQDPKSSHSKSTSVRKSGRGFMKTVTKSDRGRSGCSKKVMSLKILICPFFWANQFLYLRFWWGSDNITVSKYVIVCQFVVNVTGFWRRGEEGEGGSKNAILRVTYLFNDTNGPMITDYIKILKWWLCTIKQKRILEVRHVTSKWGNFPTGHWRRWMSRIQCRPSWF